LHSTKFIVRNGVSNSLQNMNSICQSANQKPTANTGNGLKTDVQHRLQIWSIQS